MWYVVDGDVVVSSHSSCDEAWAALDAIRQQQPGCYFQVIPPWDTRLLRASYDADDYLF